MAKRWECEFAGSDEYDTSEPGMVFVNANLYPDETEARKIALQKYNDNTCGELKSEMQPGKLEYWRLVPVGPNVEEGFYAYWVESKPGRGARKCWAYYFG